MSHSLCRVWLHIVFSTLNKDELIDESFEKDLYSQIKNKLFEEHKIYVKEVNGISNHIHILLLLKSTMTIQDVVKYMKGYTSNWINVNKLSKEYFSWRVGYGAFSVSEYNVEKVSNYIKNQKEHHKEISFEQECEVLDNLNNYPKKK